MSTQNSVFAGIDLDEHFDIQTDSTGDISVNTQEDTIQTDLALLIHEYFQQPNRQGILLNSDQQAIIERQVTNLIESYPFVTGEGVIEITIRKKQNNETTNPTADDSSTTANPDSAQLTADATVETIYGTLDI